MRLVLYQPDIAQNTGAAIRNAACFGASLEIIEPCGFPLGAKGLRRAAMDYGGLAEPRIHVSWEAFCSKRDAGRLILLTTAGEADLWEVKFRPGDIFLMGRESAGVPPEVHDSADLRVRIPIAADARSLNVATAGAIALAEARRQLGWSPPSPS